SKFAGRRESRVLWTACWLGLFAVIPGGAAEGTAAETESRYFAITIDRKPAGQFSMTITRQDDGSVAVTGSADVKVSYLVYKYRYSYQGTEVWKNRRLVSLNSTSNDNGNRYSVTAMSDNDGLRVRVNGVEHASRLDVWTTTYWQLADPRFRNQPVPLLDADTGKDIAGMLLFVGTDQLRI